MYYTEKIPFTRGMADTLVRAMQENEQYTQAMQFQHKLLASQAFERQEREQLVKEIADEVLSRISIKFNNGDALNQIKGLKQAIESLVE